VAPRRRRGPRPDPGRLRLPVTSFALPLIIREFQLTPTEAGAIGSFTNVGLLIGALIFSTLSDRYGRKTIFQWVLFTYAFEPS